MGEVKLKPCPFCGYGKPMIEDNSTVEFPNDWIIQCGGCGTAFIASNDGLPCTRNELIDRWNRRTAASPSKINENAPNSGKTSLNEEIFTDFIIKRFTGDSERF